MLSMTLGVFVVSPVYASVQSEPMITVEPKIEFWVDASFGKDDVSVRADVLFAGVEFPGNINKETCEGFMSRAQAGNITNSLPEGSTVRMDVSPKGKGCAIYMHIPSKNEDFFEKLEKTDDGRYVLPITGLLGVRNLMKSVSNTVLSLIDIKEIKLDFGREVTVENLPSSTVSGTVVTLTGDDIKNITDDVKFYISPEYIGNSSSDSSGSSWIWLIIIVLVLVVVIVVIFVVLGKKKNRTSVPSNLPPSAPGSFPGQNGQFTQSGVANNTEIPTEVRPEQENSAQTSLPPMPEAPKQD